MSGFYSKDTLSSRTAAFPQHPWRTLSTLCPPAAPSAGDTGERTVLDTTWGVEKEDQAYGVDPDKIQNGRPGSLHVKRISIGTPPPKLARKNPSLCLDASKDGRLATSPGSPLLFKGALAVSFPKHLSETSPCLSQPCPTPPRVKHVLGPSCHLSHYALSAVSLQNSPRSTPPPPPPHQVMVFGGGSLGGD